MTHPPLRIWLARHAQPLVAEGVCYGALDVPADPEATTQAAQQLANNLPQGLVVYTSTLQRCELLAQYLRGLRPDLVFKSAPKLREMDFGEWEGQRWDAISPAALQAWTDDFEHYRCGGTGESAGGVVHRVHAALLECHRLHRECVWISHAGVARAIAWLQAHSMGPLAGPTLPRPLGLQAQSWPLSAPAHGQWALMDWAGPR
jgi:alpha-ribazole phosphatase